MRFKFAAALAAGTLAAVGLLPASAYASGSGAFVDPLHSVDTIASTVPKNGDVNPYGTAVVPESRGRLHQGDVLVSNFNNKNNLQGTGTTIVDINPNGKVKLFAKIDARKLPGDCPGGVGLTTALVVLREGWVIVGSLPTTDGMPDTIGAGCLIVLDSSGKVRETISGHGINGPWDMTAKDDGGRVDVFVTNVLNGTVAGNGDVVNGGTVLRLDLSVDDKQAPRLLNVTMIGSNFPEKTDPAALVVGPTGVGLSDDGVLYVADSVGNRIAAIRDAVDRDDTAFTGRTVSTDGDLNTPLGLAIAPGGHILTVNAGDGNLVETRPDGMQIAARQLDNSMTPGSPPGAGALFGLAVVPGVRAVYFVDDATNQLNILH
jgi:hypothetical protein